MLVINNIETLFIESFSGAVTPSTMLEGPNLKIYSKFFLKALREHRVDVLPAFDTKDNCHSFFGRDNSRF